jgi:hypothetical protein
VIVIKNVILYDPYGHVVGFVELKNAGAGTYIKVKHNLAGIRLTLSINDDTHDMNIKDFATETSTPIDLDAQVKVSITERVGNTTTTLAYGSINEDEAKQITVPSTGALNEILQETEQGIIRPEPTIAIEEPPVKTSAVREIDEALRAICMIDEKGKGVCEMCPYRDFFYGETITHHA